MGVDFRPGQMLLKAMAASARRHEARAGRPVTPAQVYEGEALSSEFRAMAACYQEARKQPMELRPREC